MAACGTPAEVPADVLRVAEAPAGRAGTPLTSRGLEPGTAGWDALQFARLAKALDDETVLQRLGDDDAPEAQWSAVQLAPWLHNPMEALSGLAPLAGGRDSLLAPAAAYAAQRIAERLATEAWPAETSPSEAYPSGSWTQVIASYRALASETALRPDIQLRAGLVAELLMRTLDTQASP